jgi:hypothetical protein
MPKRWEQKVKSLRRLEMPVDRVWARIEEGPHPEPPPRIARRILVALVAFAVFAAGGSLAWLALRPTAPSTISSAGTEPPAWLVDQAYRMAYGSGDITPTSAQWVLSDADTIAPAVGLEHGDPGMQEYLVVLHGDFTAYSAKVPSGADLPTGHVLSFAASAHTHHITDWGVGGRDVHVPGLEPFTLPAESQRYTDADAGWTVAVPPGWEATGFTLGWSDSAASGSVIANANMPLPVAGDQTPPQISAEGFPDDGVALVIAPASTMSGNLPIRTPPLSIEDFGKGSAPRGGSTLDTVWFTSKGTASDGPPLVFAATLRIGPQVSRVDLDAIEDVVASLTFGPTATSAPSPTDGSHAGLGPRCMQATTSGDFDGDGTVDEAKLVAVVPADASCGRNRDVWAQMESQRIDVAFGSGQTLHQVLADCQPCLTGSEVFAAADLDGDGRDELAIDVGPGAATDYVEFYRLDPGGIRPLIVSAPGDPPYLEPGPAIFGGGFDSGQWSSIECRVTPAGTHELVSVHAQNLTGPITGPWRVHTTTMALEGDRLVVTSTDEGKSQNYTRAPGVFLNACS